MKETLLITGGKSSIGNAVLHEFLDSSDVKEIKNLSRDEKKQDDTRRFYKNPKINSVLGRMNYLAAELTRYQNKVSCCL